MKKNLLYITAMMALLGGLGSCSKDEVYDSSVVKGYQITKDGKEWSQYFGTSNKPLFIYANDGSYLVNYSSLYPFKLDNGTYRVLATSETNLIADQLTAKMQKLDEMVIAQDPDAKQAFAISAPVTYSAGDALQLDMFTRTGVLRLKATDTKADKRYSTVRAVVTSPIAAYKVSDASFVEGETVLQKDKATNSGGVSYSEDFVLLETKAADKQVGIRIDYLDGEGNVINSKPFADNFTILPNDTTQIAFALNNADEPMIQKYTVTIASEGWNEEEISPDAPVVVPNGYTYVSPKDNIDEVFNSLKNDANVDEIKLYLKAGETYAFGSKTLNDCPKAIYVVAQKPKAGQTKATVSFASISMTGDQSAIRFENVNLKPGNRVFNLKNQKFHIGEVAFVNCDFVDYNGTMWYQQSNADYQQVVDHFLFDGTCFTNLTLGSSALVGMTTKVIAPIYSWTFRNSTFHVKSFGKPLVNNTNKIDKTLTVNIENCTFVDMAGSNTNWFDFNGSKTDHFYFTAKNNVISGKGGGTPIPFNLTMTDTQTLSDNYFTKGYTVKSWGVEEGKEPTELTETIDELFEDATNGNLTIKNKSSVIYTKGIGDSRWRK